MSLAVTNICIHTVFTNLLGLEKSKRFREHWLPLGFLYETSVNDYLNQECRVPVLNAVSTIN